MIQIAFDSFLAVLLVTPAVALVGRGRARLIALPLQLAASALGVAVSGVGLWRGHAVVLDLSRLAPFPFALTVDRLSAFFLLLICSVALPVTVFSGAYFHRHYDKLRCAWLGALVPMFLLSMIVVVTASTGFAFLVGWELMTLFSAGLIVVDGDTEERRHNLFIYLLMMHAGAAAVVASFFLFLPYSASLDFSAMRSAGAGMPGGVRNIVFLLAFVGFGTKAGIIPFHLWLPRAHPIAPTPVSALMSGVMLKTAVYGLVRLAFDFLHSGPTWWGYLVLAAGALSGVLGVLYAIAEHDLKRLLAYHSVENIGIIYLGLGSSLVFLAQGVPAWAGVALAAALLHTLNHALFKSALFLGAGAISHATHNLNIDELGGLLKRMRVTGLAFLVACCSIVGLPLFNGFVSEWLTFRSFLAGATLSDLRPATVLPLMGGVLALIGGLAATCFLKVYGVAFLGRPRSSEAENAHEVPLAMRAGMSILAAACVCIGLLPGLLLRPLSIVVQTVIPGGVFPDEAFAITRAMPWIAAMVAAVLLPVALLLRAGRLAPTWACGLPGLDRRMQYTSVAFSKPVRKVFSRVYKPDRAVQLLPENQPYFPISISYHSVRTTSYEKSLYRPAVEAVVATAHRLRRLQTGNIQIYLLYIFLALVSLLVFMRLQ